MPEHTHKSTFSSKFVALRNAKNLVLALWYKLKIFKVSVYEPGSIFCDNQGIVKIASILEMMISKMHNAIKYHRIHKAVAVGVLKAGKGDNKINYANFYINAHRG